MNRFETGRSTQLLLLICVATVLQAGSAVAFPSDATAKSPEKQPEKVAATHRSRPNVSLKDSAAVATAVDKMILDSLADTETKPAPRASDEDFLRRVTFDLGGTTPSPRDVTLFTLDPDPQKRLKVVERLLESPEYAHNWAAYWRDVIFLRATDMRARAMEGVFETWMSAQIRENKGWDKITTAIVTATGDVTEHGETALMFAQSGDAADIAAETSRIFLGIQIQCANCHDHPTDKWKRQQFHQLAAFFPRLSVRRQPGGDVRSFVVASLEESGGGRGKQGGLLDDPDRMFAMLDRNRDKKITKAEVENTRLAKLFDKILENGDANKDNAITREELQKMPLPDGAKRGSAEYYMSDLKNPSSRGTKVDPVFFVNNKKPKSGLTDEQRRTTLANYMTASSNPWFARAFVNRIWAEMLGEGFYTPVDDIGPERKARMPEVLDLLADAFVAGKYDVKGLFLTIARTDAYQRAIRAKDTSVESPPVFAASTPKRLRADQLFNAITKVLGIEGADPKESDSAGKGKRPPRTPRAQFAALFGYDPSTTQEDLMGNVPQALFMMNSRMINGLIRADGKTRLSQILREYKDDKDAVKEVYILALAREPSATEEKTCLSYVKDVGDRREGFEDLMWSLMNSSEFLSKR